MLNINPNINTENINEINPNFVAVWTKNNGNNYITALGNDFAEVKEEGNFHWAVMADYEGNYKVVPFAEGNILN